MAEEAHSRYEHPLIDRYATKEMSLVWSPLRKFSTWRRLWVALAQAQRELGLAVTEQQVEEMRANIYNIDFELAAQKEKEFRHDVMGHVHAFGVACPTAMPIIHLGATSCYVGDNTDIIQMKEALVLVRRKMLKLLKTMSDFALQYKDLPTLGFTHFQPAQLTTVGKRMALWMQDFWLDFQEVERMIDELPMRGVKGTTGTQASFLELFHGDHDKVKQLNARVCELMGFSKAIPLSGQTYTRKIDYKVLSLLSGIAQSAYKMCGDIRLLASMKEIEEPFEKSQIGSSAMAYKRNPMRSERCCSLARYVMSLPDTGAQTHANQWFERTLDDSAIRRIVLPEAFLAIDVVLQLCGNITDGLAVYPNVIRSHVMAELPFMATEVILMHCVEAGGDRQHLHEVIRVHSMEAAKRVKLDGAPNDLLERIRADDTFAAIHATLDDILDPARFVGRAPQQTTEFIEEEITPLLQRYEAELAAKSVDEINV